MPKLPDIEDFIDYNPKVGPLQLLEVGYPGTGKSSHAIQVLIKCLERKKETAIMHGDISCEWRHYLNYSKYVKTIRVLYPENAKLIYRNLKVLKQKRKVKLEMIPLDFDKLKIIDYFGEQVIVVVYDDCYNAIDKTNLWVNIVRQLVFRDKLLDYTFTYLCHEAGNYYPQTAKGSQWEALDEFVTYFVFFRRMGIRAMLLSQLETEVYDRVRKKCIWKAYRICYPGDRTHARLIKKYVKKMSIDNYNLFFGDLFSPLNTNKPTKEIRTKCMMIPRVLINLNGSSHLNTHPTSKNPDLATKMIVNAHEHFESKREVSRVLGIDRKTVDRHLKLGESRGN